ncbi:MAG TPA: cupredoxin domain-containing protein [Nitrospiraceae bacterium]|nr:cupredoxin domain-containing protein [Nitrospiraceae bacterium]
MKRRAPSIPPLSLSLATALLFAGTVGLGFSESGPPVEVETAPDGVQRVSITMDSYSYTPNHLVVRAGKPVELILTSVTTLTPHNFVLKEPGAGLAVEQDVGAGKTVTVRFTPSQPGVFTFYCDKKLLFFKSHREKGMEGRLEVR